MNYRAVLFDMDGVIVDSEPLHVAAFQATLKKYDHALDDVGYKKYFAGKTDEAGFIQYSSAIDLPYDLPRLMEEKGEAFLALAKDNLKPYPGIVEIIRNLTERRIPLALVTGSRRTEAEITLQTFDIRSCFSVIIAAEDISASKPNPEGYLKAVQVLGVTPDDCIIIEDAPSGVGAARNAGIRCIAVTNTHTAEELAGATVIVEDVNEVLK